MTTLLLLLAGALGTPASALGASGTYHEEFHQIYSMQGEGRITLENIHGDVHITAWDRDEVRVDALKRASSQERLDDAHIVVDAGSDLISIKTRYPDGENSEQPAEVDYTVMVPRSARLDQVKLVNGALEIAGLKGEVHASSVSGAIRTRDLAGDVKLSTISGKLEAFFDRLDESRSISVNSVNGSIEVLLPMDAHADVQADTVSGGISSDFGAPVDRGRFPGRHLSGVLKGGGTRIRVSNVSGSICLTPVWHGKRIKFT